MHNDRYADPVSTDPTPLAPPRDVMDRTRLLSLAAVLASTVGLGLAYGVGYTVTAVRFTEWGAAGWLVGVAGAAPSLAVVALVPLAPRLAGRLGAVPVMVAGAALVALSFVLMPVLDGVGWWLLLRVQSGAGLTLPWLVGETWINTVVTDRVRGRVLGLYAMLLFSGWALGPLLVDRVGTTGLAAYAVGVLGMALCAVPLLLARRLAPAMAAHGTVRLPAAVRLAPLAMLAAVVGGVAEFGYISLLPAYALEAGASTTTSLRLLTVLLVGGICLQVLVGWLADHVDRSRLLAGLGLVLAVGATGFAGLVGTGGAPAYLAAFALGGVVVAFYAVGLTMLGERVPAGQLAVANAGFLVSYEVGATVGPVLGGAAMDVWPPHGLAVLVAVVGVGFAAGVLARRRQPTITQNG
ncbi:MFS transporter [Aquipuribacter hungaricus]|uniref:MFS transporter n=1 Tax=Aquipuribacter hungaricus TaxID=545624 RepID=A0ABV7WMR2_9MICO